MKKLSAILLGGLIVIVCVPMLAAFEAHVINVTAHIENALRVDPQEIEFGTVFPEEVHAKTFTVALSDSFIAEDRVDDVHYHLSQKPKPRPEYITEVGDAYTARLYCINTDPNCDPDYYTNCYPDLCEFLAKSSAEGEGDTEASAYLHKAEDDLSDLWSIYFDVPCIEGYEGLDDFNGTVAAEDDYGCDIWIEVDGISYPQP